MNFIDKVAWICIEDRRILCVRSHGRALAYLPGGKRDPGESDETCLHRETIEELGVTLQHGSIRWFGAFEAPADARADGAHVRLACYEADFQGELTASAEIAEFMWLTSAERDRCSPAARLVVDRLHAQERIA